MKKNILLATAIMFLYLKTYGQQHSPASDTTFYKSYKASYLSTHKTLKTAGWISLGAGIATTAIGLQSVAASTVTGKSVKWLLPGGLTLIGASIPLFVVSHHYKRKAAFLSRSNQHVFVPQQNGFTSRIAPTLCLRVPF